MDIDHYYNLIKDKSTYRLFIVFGVSKQASQALPASDTIFETVPHITVSMIHRCLLLYHRQENIYYVLHVKRYLFG